MKPSVFSSAGRAGLAALCVLLTVPAWAERADRDKPMNIEADALRYEDQKQLSTFTGKVVVTKGTIVMRGARLDEGVLGKGGAGLFRLDGDAQLFLADHLMSLRFQNAAQLAHHLRRIAH